MQETQVPSLGWEDPLEEEMATHSSILVWKIPWTEEPGGLHPWGRKELDSTEHAAHVGTEGILLGAGGAEGLKDLGQVSHLGCVLEKGVLQGRAWREGLRGAYLGEACGLRKLGAHMSLIHANQRSVQFLSSLQVIFGQRTLAECGVQSREV